MDVPNTENVFPQGTQRRTFWESHTDMQSNFMHGTYNEHLFDGNESSEMADIINNDSSDSESKSFTLLCLTVWGSNKQGVVIFLDFHKLGGDNKVTCRENLNNPEGNKRGDDPSRWC